jgi:hypothetical protein
MFPVVVVIQTFSVVRINQSSGSHTAGLVTTIKETPTRWTSPANRPGKLGMAGNCLMQGALAAFAKFHG